jgi:hypothetical protein
MVRTHIKGYVKVAFLSLAILLAVLLARAPLKSGEEHSEEQSGEGAWQSMASFALPCLPLVA